MGETKVKICGLQDVEVLKSMIRLPVDYIGFVFAPSRRRIEPEQAAALAALLREWPEDAVPGAVGVFRNPSPDELRQTLDTVPLDVVQLHGNEPPELCLELRRAYPELRIWKVISEPDSPGVPAAGPDETLGVYAGCVDAVLLDTYDPHQGGGSGRTFAWDRIPAYREQASRMGLPLMVAGGLNPDNVGELLRGYEPWGVDVSSGVETDGVKDIAKITAFIERVKQP